MLRSHDHCDVRRAFALTWLSFTAEAASDIFSSLVAVI